MDDAVHDGVGAGAAAGPGVPALLPELCAEDRGGRAVTSLHEPGQEAPEELVRPVEQPLVERERLEGRVPPRDLPPPPGRSRASRHSPSRSGQRIWQARIRLWHAALATARARWVLPVPVGPRGATPCPRSAKPRVAGSVTGGRSGPRPSGKSTDLASASGQRGLARLARFLTLGVTRAECASSTAIRTRSAQVIPMHMPSSWASSAPSRSAAPMSRGFLSVSIESSVALRLPAEIRAAHAAGLVVAGPRPGGQALAGLQYRLKVPVPGRRPARGQRHLAGALEPGPGVAVLEPGHREGRAEALLLVVHALEDAVHRLPAGRAGAVRPPPYALGVPIGVRPPPRAGRRRASSSGSGRRPGTVGAWRAARLRGGPPPSSP